MTDLFDKAQAVEQEFRDRALAAQLAKPIEQPMKMMKEIDTA